MGTWSEEQLTSHGVALTDEGFHPVAPGDKSWNESVFFDWIAEDGERAGHCRIGRFPGQGRLWVWIYVLERGRWFGFDEPSMPLDTMAPDRWAAESSFLSFDWSVERPLAKGRLTLTCNAHVIAGPERGAEAPLSIDLVFDAAGPAHGMASRDVRGKDGATYKAGRFEQPCDVSGTVTIDGVPFSVQGRGERDHSWGPRFWAMQWLFLVLAGSRVRAQCTEVIIGGRMRVCVGYVQSDVMTGLDDVRFELAFDDTALIDAPFSGTVCATAGDTVVEGQIEPLAGIALDDSHCLPSNVHSTYTRHLIRFTPADGGDPVLGWLEAHRLKKPTP